MVIGIEANHANKEQRTGVENYCWQMITNLKEQIPSDVRVILYSQKPLLPGLADDMPVNWEVKILKWPFNKLWSQMRLSLEIILNPPDIFFAPGQLIPFGCPKNTVVTVHDSAFKIFPKVYRFFGRQYLKWMNKRIADKAKVILTPSQFSKNEFIKLYSFPAEKILVTPLGYDEKIFNFDATQEDFKKNLKITKPFIFYVGRLEEKKNVFTLIKAFEKIKNDFDYQLVLAGKPGFGYEKIEKLLAQSLWSKDIIIPGWLSDREVASCLKKAKIFVFPSFYEGFGLPLLEAFACGCPVIAAKGHSLEEVGANACEYFEAENWLDLAKKITDLLSDDSKLSHLRQQGFIRVKEYSWYKTADLTKKACLELQN